MADQSALSFPDLFRESYVDYADCRIRYTTEAAPDELVARLHLVAVTADGKVVVCRSKQGWRFLPGGTREPGESLHDLARRELMEEAGAVLEGDLRYFAAHVADSNRDKPFRPHLPHPRTYWAYATAQVRLVCEPINPEDGGTVVEVVTLCPTAAADYIEDHDQVHADVLRHAVALGLLPLRPDEAPSSVDQRGP
jgi:8-oxo-dGTP diphosphatase